MLYICLFCYKFRRYVWKLCMIKQIGKGKWQHKYEYAKLGIQYIYLLIYLLWKITQLINEIIVTLPNFNCDHFTFSCFLKLMNDSKQQIFGLSYWMSSKTARSLKISQWQFGQFTPSQWPIWELHFWRLENL